MTSNVRKMKNRDSLTDSIRIETKTSSIGFSTLKEKTSTREVYDSKLLKWVPYVSDPDNGTSICWIYVRVTLSPTIRIAIAWIVEGN